MGNSNIILKINDEYYDLTEFIYSHPGGIEIIKKYNNKDATVIFEHFHKNNQKIKDMMQKYKIKN